MKNHDMHQMLPVSGHVDVLVVGGGPAGVAAAFCAARMGAKTLLIEQFNCLGGVATAGGHGHMGEYSAWRTDERIVGGIPFEIAQRVAAQGYSASSNRKADFEVEGLKLVLEQMAGECGCELLYHTFFSDTVVENEQAVGVVVQNKDGRSVIYAKRIIDCTGDGDVAARAGCAFETGDEETGLCQPMTLMFTVGGVDYDRVKKWRTDYDMKHVWKKAQDEGFMRPFQSKIMGFWWTPTRPDHLGINFTHINFVDATKAEDLTKATIEGRKQAFESIEIFRRYVPGMENCYMISTPNTVGVRESRRIIGEYTLTRNDVVSETQFEDSIGYGSFYIDIHGTSGPGMDVKQWEPRNGFRYQIPYRILVPMGVDNLMVAGRCVSCDHEALGSLRVMPQCGVMGQAAGVATVLSIKNNGTPRSVDIVELQTCLKQQGCIVDDTDICAAELESKSDVQFVTLV